MKRTSRISRVNDGALLYITQRFILFSPAPQSPAQLNRPSSSSSSLSSSYVTQFETSASTDLDPKSCNAHLSPLSQLLANPLIPISILVVSRPVESKIHSYVVLTSFCIQSKAASTGSSLGPKRGSPSADSSRSLWSGEVGSCCEESGWAGSSRRRRSS